MEITPSNYHSHEAGNLYMSHSQYGSWMTCAAREYAIRAGEYAEEKKPFLLAGQYAHVAMLEPEKLDAFEADHPEIRAPREWTLNELKTMAEGRIDLTGAKTNKTKIAERLAAAGFPVPEPEKTFRGDFRWLPDTLAAFQRQNAFVSMVERGESEVIIIFPLGAFAGAPVMWKAMLDNVRAEDRQFDDLKFMKDFEGAWCNKRGARVGWHELRYYDRQMAVYQEAARYKYGDEFIPNIIAASKQSPPDVDWLQFRDSGLMSDRLEEVRASIERVMAWKLGEEEAPRCESTGCAFCRETKTARPRVAARSY